MSEDMYTRNYFRRDETEGRSEEKVPIWWMAPESIEKIIYNERTDVVRFFYIIAVIICILLKTANYSD